MAFVVMQMCSTGIIPAKAGTQSPGKGMLGPQRG
jgi:hypothetical protein